MNRKRVLPSLRQTCFDCFRPAEQCYCDSIPRIDNRTNVLIIQHRGERFHPFNTARMVVRSLKQSELVCGRVKELASQELPIRSDAALLFPSDCASDLESMRADQFPSQLVILDGTWHHAKQLMRELPQLRKLRRLKLVPDQPGNFRIRYEPTKYSLATVEAVVQSLACIEPETPGLFQLNQCFNRMVDKQLAHPSASYDGLPFHLRCESNPNVPKSIREHLAELVVAGVEWIPRISQARNGHSGWPVVWMAERLSDGRTFTAFLGDVAAIPKTKLNQMKLTESSWLESETLDQFRTRWNSFTQGCSPTVVFNKRQSDLLQSYVDMGPCEILKSINVPELNSALWIDGDLPHEITQDICQRMPGRLGERLARSVSVVRFLSGKYGLNDSAVDAGSHRD